MFTVVVTLRSSLRACRHERELLVEAVDDAHRAVMDGAQGVLVEDERGEIVEAVSFEDLVSTNGRVTTCRRTTEKGPARWPSEQ